MTVAAACQVTNAASRRVRQGAARPPRGSAGANARPVHRAMARPTSSPRNKTTVATSIAGTNHPMFARTISTEVNATDKAAQIHREPIQRRVRER